MGAAKRAGPAAPRGPGSALAAAVRARRAALARELGAAGHASWVRRSPALRREQSPGPSHRRLAALF